MGGGRLKDYLANSAVCASYVPELNKNLWPVNYDENKTHYDFY